MTTVSKYDPKAESGSNSGSARRVAYCSNQQDTPA